MEGSMKKRTAEDKSDWDEYTFGIDRQTIILSRKGVTREYLSWGDYYEKDTPDNWHSEWFV